MGRMDKYEDNKNTYIKSRTERNEDLYKDIYMNASIVSLDEVLMDDSDEEELLIEEKVTVNEPIIEEKNYDVNVYLEKAKEKRLQENIKKIDEDNIDYEKIKIQNDEISRLISEIENKEKENDLFKDLLPDNDNTIETTGVVDTKLNTVITNTDDDVNADINDFEEIDKDLEKVVVKKHKIKKLPIIVFISSLLLLIIVIILLILK